MSREKNGLVDTCGKVLAQTVKAGDKVLAAVSGGVDSMVMLDVLLQLKDVLGITVEVGHIHHHLRVASDEEWAFVAAHCAALNVPFHGRHIDVRMAQSESGSSMEAAAHQLRHEALREMMTAVGAQHICLAHHANDRAETVLMNLLRGSSIKGLAAMGAVNGVIVRPLLAVTRDEIEAYARKGGLRWVTDESNSDTTILRNRLRHELMPALCAYNPHIVEALNHLAESSEVASDYIEDEARALYEDAVVLQSEHFFLLKREVVLSAHEAVTSALLRQLVEALSSARHSLHYEMVKHALARIAQGQGRYDLGKGRLIEATKKWIYIGEMPKGKWQQEDGGYRHEFLKGWIPLEKEGAFAVRISVPGDAISLANLGHKQLKKIFQEQGWPSVLRKIWPIIYDIKTKEVIWVPFLAQSSLLMYYNSVTFSEVDRTITIAGKNQRLTF